MENKPIIFFDAVCLLCSSSVQFILKYEKNEDLLFSSLQSDFGQKFLTDNNLNKKIFESIILFENGKIYCKSTAIFKILKYLKFPFPFFYFFIILPKVVRDFLYEIIANNRYNWFGKKDSCYVPAVELKKRFIN